MARGARVVALAAVVGAAVWTQSCLKAFCGGGLSRPEGAAVARNGCLGVLRNLFNLCYEP